MIRVIGGAKPSIFVFFNVIFLSLCILISPFKTFLLNSPDLKCVIRESDGAKPSNAVFFYII